MSVVRIVQTASYHHVEPRLVPHGEGESGSNIRFRVDGRVIGELPEGEPIMRMLERTGLLLIPRQIGLVGYEEDGHVHAAIMLVISSAELADCEMHPLDSGLQGVREATAQNESREKIDLLRLGQAVRPYAHRNNPDDLHAELADMLTLLVYGNRTPSAAQKAIDDLLRSV
jgi:hypothetical protein